MASDDLKLNFRSQIKILIENLKGEYPIERPIFHFWVPIWIRGYDINKKKGTFKNSSLITGLRQNQ